eukprot:5274844-Prymnesium_polylepis.1
MAINNAAGESFLVDAADPATSNLARYLNHARDPNVIIMRAAYDPLRRAKDDPPPRLHMLTCRDVRRDEELCFDYGEQFWDGRSALRRSEEELERREERLRARAARRRPGAGVARAMVVCAMLHLSAMTGRIPSNRRIAVVALGLAQPRMCAKNT